MTQARRPPVALVYRRTHPGISTVVNQISITQRLTELLRARTDRSETAALRRDLEELRRRVGGLSGRPLLDAAVRRAVEEYQKKHPLPAAKPPRQALGGKQERGKDGWVLLLPGARGPALLRASMNTAPALRTALRHWARPPAPPPAPSRPFQPGGAELRHRRAAPEERRGSEEARGEAVLHAQRARPIPPAVKREEAVTRDEVRRMLRELPPPDVAALTEQVTARLESALRTERRRIGRGI